MACRYPDATSPNELWENALAGRRAFRRLPDERMNLADYWDRDPSVPDRFYARNAAVIEGYEFDRAAHRIAGSTYRSTDLTHWLALDIAGRALADAGFPEAEGLPRKRAGVVVGNTLTGEFARANLMRLRWPYVRRVVGGSLREQGWSDERLDTFLTELERSYKSPFPAPDEDTLAGGLSNTIAGRICNHFDLNGGGYTVDGACSSSLLSVATACRGLRDGEWDVAVAGGVDLSIDPFEIVGFAKTGALARGEMRVYDRGSNGFWPGEGCGMVVLMRERDAVASGHRVYATLSGWGVSSDGRGGITRPEASGYRLALGRAYEMAGFDVGSVTLFEGHGTGTEVGDATELSALAAARAEAGTARGPAAIGSIKGMIGHTKAAAGVAALIKTALAVHHGVLPPSVGSFEPHQVLEENPDLLRVLRQAEPWPTDAPLRAGVTAMGFGGINTHVAVEGVERRRRPALNARARDLATTAQDAELLLLDAASPTELRSSVAELTAFVPRLSYADLADLAAETQRGLRELPYRAALVVASPDDAELRLRRMLDHLDAGEESWGSTDGQDLYGRAGAGRIGFLFPGQGSGHGVSGGALRRRFPEAAEAYTRAALPSGADAVATEVAQPRIVTGSLAGLRALASLGVEAEVAVGHSLGEISALHWAGALGESALLRVAATRGETMARHSSTGTMAGVEAAPDVVRSLIGALPLVVAGFNGPEQTVVAGPPEAVDAFGEQASAAGVRATRLRVSHAFHSPLVAPAADAFADRLADEEFGPVMGRVVSTVTGEPLVPETDVRALLRRQIVEPVRFAQAVAAASDEVDLWIEVGPGRVLAGLAGSVSPTPAVALDTDDESLTGLLRVVGTAYVAGAPVDHGALFRGRPARPLPIGRSFTFLTSPCEEVPTLTPGQAPGGAPAPKGPAEEPSPLAASGSSLEILRRLVAERVELPGDLVSDDSRLLEDLHLSSITGGQLFNQAAGYLGVSLVQPPTNFATATLAELAEALDSLAQNAPEARRAPAAEGATAWARAWSVALDEVPLPAGAGASAPGHWDVHAVEGDPLAAPLAEALTDAALGGGQLVCLPEHEPERHLSLALAGARAALTGPSDGRLVLLQPGGGAAGLAKSLHLEAPGLRVTVVRAPAVPEAVAWTVQEAAATVGFAEAHYDAEGVRRVPTLRAMPVRAPESKTPLGPQDVLLVTGGGKGITAECALALAGDSGAALALLGRSSPDEDAELAANLRRMADAGVTVGYARADVTDRQQVRDAVAELAERLGAVTAVLHGAGRNAPTGLATLTETELSDTMAPKTEGLRAVLEAVDTERLRLLVTFGSVIGRVGLRGEAHYATANEWLATLTEEFAATHPDCRTMCVEWSVWSGVGMGERLSVVESLAHDGITPLTPDQGVEIMRRLVADAGAPPVVVVSGRTGAIDTVRLHAPELPLLRFVGEPLVRYHGVELVSEVELSAGTDLYLADHLLDDNLLFPAVLGLEAMAQAAAAAVGERRAPAFEDVEFPRPVIVPPNGTTTIRVAATVVDDGLLRVVLRSEETGFAADHFRALLRFGEAPPPAGPPERVPAGLPPVPLDPTRDLYGSVLFQGRRFQRLTTFHRAAARAVDVETVPGPTDWFADFLPGELLLGDPGVRDTLMHGNQVCVPDATLLPVRIERLRTSGPRPTAEPLRFSATERHQDGDTYVYDIAVRTPDGEVVERWDGLWLRAVRRLDGTGPWVAPLLGSYLERTLEEVTGARVAVAVEPDGPEPAERGERTALAAGRALGRPATVDYRPDGRPEVAGTGVSASHGAGVTLCVAGSGALGCDVEAVAPRTAEEWAGLLGAYLPVADLLAKESGESTDSARTRVWSAVECLRKAGLPLGDAPLTLAARERTGWSVLVSGTARIATFATALRNVNEQVVFAILSEGRSLTDA
ncbi:type I polyketide synthase [Streptomyces sedi]